MTYYKKLRKISKIIYLDTDNASYVDPNRKEFTFRVAPVCIEDKSILYVRQYSNDYRGSGVSAVSAVASTGIVNNTINDKCFVRTPTISFISSTGTGATASAVMTPAQINGTDAAATATSSATISVVAGGAGYTTPPVISVNNTGTNGVGLTITAATTAGALSSATITNNGRGYTVLPTLTVSAPQASVPVSASITASATGVISAFTVNNAGTNGYYNATPTLTFNHNQVPAVITYGTSATGTITSATLANASLNGYYGTTAPTISVVPGTHLNTIAVASAGNGYRSAPIITITDTSGYGATATATVVSGQITAITVSPSSRGTNYTSSPTITIAPPNAERATATFNTNSAGTISSVNVLTGGGFYNAVPSVSIPAAFATDSVSAATLTAVLTTGSVSSITLVGGGSGYLPNLSNVPLIIGAPVQATATIGTIVVGGVGGTINATLDSNGRVTSVAVGNAGTGYLVSATGLPTTVGAMVNPTPPSGGMAATIVSGRITAIAAPTTGGLGYINTTTVVATNGLTTPVQATIGRITFVATSIAAVRVNTSGYGYIEQPIAVCEAPGTWAVGTSTYLDTNSSPQLLTTTLGRETAGNRLIIKLRGIQYNANSYHNSDGMGDPTICVGYINGMEADDGDYPPLSIPSQTFDSFTLILSDKYGNGIGNNKMTLAIAIVELEKEDRSYIDMKRQAYN